MKSVELLFLLFIIVTFNTGISNAQWIHTNGTYGLDVRALATSGTNIFAGTYGDGIFLSTNSGISWTAVDSSLTNKNILSLIVSGENIFAGTWGNGVFLSTNNGTTWTTINTGLTDSNVTTFATCLFNGDSANPYIFAGTYGGGVFLSTNNGSNWIEVNTGLTNYVVRDLVINPDGTNLFAGTDDGVFFSINKGTSWTAVNNGLTTRYVYTLAICGTYVYAGTTTGGVFRSTNNGNSWTAVNNGLTNTYIRSFLICPFVGESSETNIFVGTGWSGVFHSNDYGTNWMQINTGLTNYQVDALIISINAAGDTNLYAGTDDGVWRRPLSEIITNVENIDDNNPNHFSLSQNYPNPFNPTTSIQYAVSSREFVTLKVYDLLGREVATLINEEKPAGEYEIEFNASGLASGIYFYKLQAGSYSSIKKMICLK